MAKPMLTVEDVAERLRVSCETVRRWLCTGQLQGTWLGDRPGWRIPPEALEQFMRERAARRSGRAEREKRSA